MAKIRRQGEAVKVTIVTHTADPVNAIVLAQKNMTGDMQHDINAFDRVEVEATFRDLCKTELQGAFEFAHFNIQLEGVSRAFQQQLTRTRLAAYSAESLRFTEAGMEVLVGPHLVKMSRENRDPHGDGVDWELEYAMMCDRIGELYDLMVDDGVPVEDARGILPLNILSKVGMSVSYKTLVHMSRVRMCYQSQAGEWGPVFSAIVEQLAQVDPLLTLPFGAFCDQGEPCPFHSRLDRDCPRRK
jgi:thymidylate synthase (FAD)